MTVSIREFLSHSGWGRAGLGLSAFLVLIALCAPWIAPCDPASQNLSRRLQRPSLSHWMGTDELGRDELSRVLYGARVSVLVSFSVVLGSGIIGVAIGSAAALAGGWVDGMVNVLFLNAFLSFPGILLAIALAAFLGPGLGNVILALIVTGWAGYARLARAQVLQVRELDYIAAARSLGASPGRILKWHVLPNILPAVLVQATTAVAGAILAESTLSFLGLGVLAPTPSWGSMLSDARSHFFDAPYLAVFPALAVALTVLAFNVFGDALRDWLDPRMRSELMMGEWMTPEAPLILPNRSDA
jgi:peptide/nickel transport system permease protein